MAYQLSDINFKTVADPCALIEEGDARYRAGVNEAADRIVENYKISPIVLLSGPSGSGWKSAASAAITWVWTITSKRSVPRQRPARRQESMTWKVRCAWIWT